MSFYRALADQPAQHPNSRGFTGAFRTCVSASVRELASNAQDSSDKQPFPGERFENFGNSPSYGGFDLFRTR